MNSESRFPELRTLIAVGFIASAGIGAYVVPEVLTGTWPLSYTEIAAVVEVQFTDALVGSKNGVTCVQPPLLANSADVCGALQNRALEQLIVQFEDKRLSYSTTRTPDPTTAQLHFKGTLDEYPSVVSAKQAIDNYLAEVITGTFLSRSLTLVSTEVTLVDYSRPFEKSYLRILLGLVFGFFWLVLTIAVSMVFSIGKNRVLTRFRRAEKEKR